MARTCVLVYAYRKIVKTQYTQMFILLEINGMDIIKNNEMWFLKNNQGFKILNVITTSSWDTTLDTLKQCE